jgi:hypothetical protein
MQRCCKMLQRVQVQASYLYLYKFLLSDKECSWNMYWYLVLVQIVTTVLFLTEVKAMCLLSVFPTCYFTFHHMYILLLDSVLLSSWFQIIVFLPPRQASLNQHMNLNNEKLHTSYTTDGVNCFCTCTGSFNEPYLNRKEMLKVFKH